MGSSKNVGINLDKVQGNPFKQNNQKPNKPQGNKNTVKKDNKSFVKKEPKEPIDETTKIKMAYNKYKTKSTIFKIFKSLDHDTREAVNPPFKYCKLIKVKDENDNSKYYLVDLLSTQSDSNHADNLEIYGAHLHKDKNIMFSINNGKLELHCEAHISSKIIPGKTKPVKKFKPKFNKPNNGKTYGKKQFSK